MATVITPFSGTTAWLPGKTREVTSSRLSGLNSFQAAGIPDSPAVPAKGARPPVKPQKPALKGGTVEGRGRPSACFAAHAGQGAAGGLSGLPVALRQFFPFGMEHGYRPKHAVRGEQ